MQRQKNNFFLYNEGVRPIFDRGNIIVNTQRQEERMVVTSSKGNNKGLSHRPSSSSTDAHTSRDHSKEEYRTSEHYSSKSRRIPAKHLPDTIEAKALGGLRRHIKTANGHPEVLVTGVGTGQGRLHREGAAEAGVEAIRPTIDLDAVDLPIAGKDLEEADRKVVDDMMKTGPKGAKSTNLREYQIHILGPGETRMGARLKLDETELKSIKVSIVRRNISEPNTSEPLERSLEDPSQLVVHYRPDEGVRPIFDRGNIIVNTQRQEERMVVTSSEGNNKGLSHRPSSSSTVAHTSRAHSKEGYRTSEHYSSKSRRSKSNSRNTPPRYHRSKSPRRSPEVHKKRERSPRRSHDRHSRSPSNHKTAPPEKLRSQHRSRTPPPRSSSRGRSRSYSPHYRSRRSRSPYRRERSRRSRSRSSRRYDEDRSERREKYEPPGIPNPYFGGAEFCFPNPMLHHMMPPGPFPYPFRPGMPPMIPPRMPFRPRIGYNGRPPWPRTTPTTSAAVGSSSVVTTTTS
ncbi:hypothetical protein Zmor_024371 [Zophobas morio]|uniref:Transformer n=1 Tax=Zophobas morio TaxID=2755281 RepID=A0AA38I0G4_9CUCU|nr:hypothetical protein Zmor_024371 [Zophobas morio]